jgi:hypothetical protein
MRVGGSNKMTAKSMDDLTQYTDMVDALVDDSGAHENWSFASSPAGVRQDDVRGLRQSHHPPLPAGVLALPLEACFFNTPRVKTPQPDNAPMLTKIFVGNMRFEMTREALRWVIVNSCGVDIPVTHILVHVKSATNNGQPTGCASIYVSENDAERVLEMNQRIFCSATFLYVASSVELMTKLINDRTILDVDNRGKKLRGPKNSMVFERSRATPTPTPTGSFTDLAYNPPPFAMSTGIDSPIQPSSFASVVYSPPRMDGTSAPATPPVPVDAPVYERYPLIPPGVPIAAAPLADPVELFIGGIRYEATRSFVAWMLTRALARRGLAVAVTDAQVRLFPNALKRRANNAGCAIVRLERSEADKLLLVNHCVLCDAAGAYFASTADAMQRFITNYHDKMRGGPSHAVVIELRKSNGASPPRPPQYFPPYGAPGFVAMGALDNGHDFGDDQRPPEMPSWMTSYGER